MLIACPGCGARLKVADSAAGRRLRCPKCGGAVDVPAHPVAPAPLERVLTTQPTPPPGPPRPFIARLGTVFFYPFSSPGAIIFLAFITPFWAALRTGVLPFGFLLRVIVGGYIAAYMFNVMLETAMDRDRAPGAPDATDMGELVGTFCRFFGAAFVAFVPVVLTVVVAAFAGGMVEEEGVLPLVGGFLAAFIAACAFGVAYYPMALMLIGFAERWLVGFNYIFGMRSIFRILGDYFVCVAFFIVTFSASFLLESYWLAAGEERSFSSAAVAFLVTTFVELYLYVVQMRALGLLYAANKDRLGWFR